MQQTELTDVLWTKFTFEAVDSLEANDLASEVFRRRMGMRKYFKELKMNLKRISDIKTQ